jgi:predicted Fe-Mo cluster-binding NifX family protein
MKIAITSQGKDSNAEVDPRFGRCSYFLIYDTEAKTLDALENTNVSAGGGAGIQAAQTVAEKGVNAILTGNVGPNAFQTLSAADITVYAGVSGKVSEVIDQFAQGSLQPYSAPSVQAHHGMGGAGSQTSQSKKKRIAVAAEGDQGMDASVSAHFGRCPFYTIVDAEENRVSLSYKVENPFYGAHGQPGQVPGFIRDQGVEVIIAGGMGPRAVGFFNEFGIEVVTGATGKVQDIVDAYLRGTLSGAAPCKHESCH